MKCKIAVLFFLFAGFVGFARAQGTIASTGGLGGDIEPTGHSNVHLLNERAGLTTFPLVDGQNPEGAPARQTFLPWAEAVALGKTQDVALHAPETLGAVARRYRKPQERQ